MDELCLAPRTRQIRGTTLPHPPSSSGTAETIRVTQLRRSDADRIISCPTITQAAAVQKIKQPNFFKQPPKEEGKRERENCGTRAPTHPASLLGTTPGQLCWPNQTVTALASHRDRANLHPPIFVGFEHHKGSTQLNLALPLLHWLLSQQTRLCAG